VGVSRITDGQTYLLDREPFRFVNRGDNKRVIAKGGDTWQSLAAEHLQPINNAEELWWVLADFQPDPIVDPTEALEAGRVIFIPSSDFVLSEIFADARRDEVEL
jgi:hypothetical protein